MNKDELKNGEEPLVSVVLCFYNDEIFLKESIESVLLQDYHHWELLLVDDGSTDESTAIAKQYASGNPAKVFYIDHPYHQNKGLSASRNAGIRKSRGAYVAFLDSGDVWLPEKMTYQVEILRTQPASVILETSLQWQSWRDPQRQDTLVPVGAVEGIYKPPCLVAALYPLGTGTAPCPSGIMIQRSALRRCLFEEVFRGIFEMYEDQAFLCKVYLKETVFVSARCHHKHRLSESSMESSAHDSGNYHKVRSYYLYWFKDYLRTQPFRYKSVERLLRRAQMPYREPMLYKVLVDVPQQVRKMFIRLLIRLGILNYGKSW